LSKSYQQGGTSEIWVMPFRYPWWLEFTQYAHIVDLF